MKVRDVPHYRGAKGNYGRVRKPKKRSGREPDDFAGSTPVSTTESIDRVVQRLRHLHDTQEIEGSIPGRATSGGSFDFQ